MVHLAAAAPANAMPSATAQYTTLQQEVEEHKVSSNDFDGETVPRLSRSQKTSQ